MNYFDTKKILIILDTYKNMIKIYIIIDNKILNLNILLKLI